MFTHQRVVVQPGIRSGLPIIVAVHSTALGPAIGGCRMAPYEDWRDGLEDALRLSAAMSDKVALAGLPNGGGKTVVVLEPGQILDAAARRDALHDVGDVIDALHGLYVTGPDVGTGPADMLVIRERTPYVFCRPVEEGGSGDSSPATAAGVIAALGAVVGELFGSPELRGRRFGVLGLGQVGARVARQLAEAGAELVVSDVDQSRRALADSLGAKWMEPDDLLYAEVDVLVPAALGGVLTPDVVAELRCLAVAGPANSQLDEPATAGLLHRRGILWAPDYLVSAGGVIYASGIELRDETPAQANARVAQIGDTLTSLFQTARQLGVSPESRLENPLHSGAGSARQA